MSAALRIVLGLLALGVGRRARRPRASALAGALGAAAVFGPGAPELPSPGAFGAGLLLAALLLTALRADLHSPLVSESAAFTFALAAGAGGATAIAFRDAGAANALAGGGVVFAAVAAWGGEGGRANAEAGWRRGASWAAAPVLAGLVAGGGAALAEALPPRLALLSPAASLVVAALAWAPSLLLERRRVRRELAEEARLGILPEEDLAVLGSPWRRRRESRFGRADERREYVRCALLLAVARQQQRRRTGQAERLRQLEVLAFRTRVRRVVEGRGARFAGVPDEAGI